MEGTISILMPSKVHECVQSVQTQQTGRQSVLLINAVTLSLTSIKAVVAARENSRKSRDFKAVDARFEGTVCSAIVRATSTHCEVSLCHILARQELQEVKVRESLRPTIANGKLQSMSNQRQQAS